MKKVLSAICVILAFLVLLNLFVNLVSSEFRKDLVGKNVSVKWEEVNVRKGHSTSSKVLDTLQRFDSVVLTGKTYRDDNYLWMQIRYNGKTAWIVASSIYT